MSSILNRLKRVEKSVERERAQQLESSSQEQSASQEDPWLSADAMKNKQRQEEEIKFHEIKKFKTPLDNIVWAKYENLKKGFGSAFFPARIIPHSKGLFYDHIPTPIPADMELVEYLGLPTTAWSVHAVKRSDIHRYNAVCREKRQKAVQQMLFKKNAELCWSTSYLNSMHKAIFEKYKPLAAAEKVFDHVLSTAKEILELAIEASYEEKEFNDNAIVEDDCEDQRRMQPALNIDEVALKYSDAEVRIHVGDSVCYNHKIMRERGLMTTKIVNIRGDSDLELENGDILVGTDLVKIIPAVKGSTTPVFKQLNEHIFIYSVGDTSQTQTSGGDTLCESPLKAINTHSQESGAALPPSNGINAVDEILLDHEDTKGIDHHESSQKGRKAKASNHSNRKKSRNSLDSGTNQDSDCALATARRDQEDTENGSQHSLLNEKIVKRSSPHKRGRNQNGSILSYLSSSRKAPDFEFHSSQSQLEITPDDTADEDLHRTLPTRKRTRHSNMSP